MIDKKLVLVIVVIALVLSTVSIVYNMVESGEKVMTVNTKHVINGKDLTSGKIGVKVESPVIEDKNE